MGIKDAKWKGASLKQDASNRLVTDKEKTIWNNKANNSHTHAKSDIKDFPSSLPASDVYAWAKASSKPSYSWSEITNKPSTFNPSSHNHDSSYIPFSGSIVSNPNTATFSISKALSGYLLFANTGDTNGVAAGIGGVNGANDGWSVRGYQTTNNKGCLEISVGDDGDEGIYVRQYTSADYKLPFMNKAGSASGLNYREIVLMEPNTGNSIFPGTVTAKTFKGTLSGNASSASSVAWSGVTGKPSTFPPSSHSHSYVPLSGGTMTGTLSLKNTGLQIISNLPEDFSGTPRGDRQVLWYSKEFEDDSDKYEDYCTHYINLGTPNSGTGNGKFGADVQVRFYQGDSNRYTNIHSNGGVKSNISVVLPVNSGTLQVSSSDVKLKTNITDTEVDDAISFINKIHLHSFDWKTDDTHQPIGFIADELEELDERLSVGGNSDELDENGLPIDPKCVNTFYLQGYEVKAIQELSSKVDTLEKENNKLKSRLTKLENKLSKM